MPPLITTILTHYPLLIIDRKSCYAVITTLTNRNFFSLRLTRSRKFLLPLLIRKIFFIPGTKSNLAEDDGGRGRPSWIPLETRDECTRPRERNGIVIGRGTNGNRGEQQPAVLSGRDETRSPVSMAAATLPGIGDRRGRADTFNAYVRTRSGSSGVADHSRARVRACVCATISHARINVTLCTRVC